MKSYSYGQYVVKVNGVSTRMVVLPDVPTDCGDEFIVELFKNSLKLNTTDLLIKRWRAGVIKELHRKKMHRQLIDYPCECQLFKVSPQTTGLPDVTGFLDLLLGNVLTDPRLLEQVTVRSCVGGYRSLLVAFFTEMRQGSGDANYFGIIPDSDVLAVLSQLEKK